MNLHSIWPLLLSTGVLLGLGVPLAKAAAAHGVGALAFAFWPTLAAGSALALLGLARHGRDALSPALLRFGAVAGLLGHALPMSAVFWLSSQAGAGFAAFAFTLPPVFTLAIALLLGVERPAPGRIAAVAIGFAGALLLASGRGGSFEPTLPAVALLLAIPASIGAGNVYRAVRLPAGVPGEWLSALTLLSSSALLAPVALAQGALALPLAAAPLGWLALQAAALVGGYLLYFALQRRAGPVTFSFIGHVMMLTGVAVGTWAFDERLAWTAWPALALVAAALRLMHRSAPPASRGLAPSPSTPTLCPPPSRTTP